MTTYTHYVLGLDGDRLIAIEPPTGAWEGYEFGLDADGCLSSMVHYTGRLGQHLQQAIICGFKVRTGDRLETLLQRMLPPEVRRSQMQANQTYGMVQRIGIRALLEGAMAA